MMCVYYLFFFSVNTFRASVLYTAIIFSRVTHSIDQKLDVRGCRVHRACQNCEMSIMHWENREIKLKSAKSALSNLQDFTSNNKLMSIIILYVHRDPSQLHRDRE